MASVYLYGLTDPRTGLVGYVGRAANPVKRWRQHLAEPGGHGQSDDASAKHKWLADLRSQGVDPSLAILDCVPADDADRRERELIDQFRRAGQCLGNGHDRHKPHRPAIIGQPTAAARLKAARRRAKLTMAEVGALIGVTEATISRWEGGSRRISTSARILLRERLGAKL
jgi:DNA-binding transcriptional regulator YiaG